MVMSQLIGAVLEFALLGYTLFHSIQPQFLLALFDYLFWRLKTNDNFVFSPRASCPYENLREPSTKVKEARRGDPFARVIFVSRDIQMQSFCYFLCTTWPYQGTSGVDH